MGSEQDKKRSQPGAIGNDSPIEAQREYWYSAQLGVNLISRLDDPRVRTQSFELSEINLGEPDKKLFKIGKDMKVIDLPKYDGQSDLPQRHRERLGFCGIE